MTGFGLDVGATKTLGVAIDDDGRILAQVRRPTGPGAEGVVGTVGDVVAELHAVTGATPEGPVGVGVPGLVDIRDGTLRHAVNLGVNGDRHPLGDQLAAQLGRDVVLENDVTVAALGMSAVSDVRDLALLSIGTGLAAGLVLDGRLRRGHLGAAGEIGHLPVVPDGLPCSCGQHGCLETVASGSALAAAWPTTRGFAAQELYAAAASGDAAAIAVRDRFARGVASAVRLMVLTVDVEFVALGGGVSHVGEPLLTSVRDALELGGDDSTFVGSLEVADRVCLVPDQLPVAAIGAALLGRTVG